MEGRSGGSVGGAKVRNTHFNIDLDSQKISVSVDCQKEIFFKVLSTIPLSLDPGGVLVVFNGKLVGIYSL